MAPFRRKRNQAPNPAPVPNAIVAAVNRVKSDIYSRNLLIPKTQWADEAWRQYDLNGELRFACTWLGNALSRCRLIAADVSPGGQILRETSNAEVQGIISGFVGSPGKQAELLMKLGVFMTVPGDCYIVATTNPNGEFDSWCVHSADEVSSVGQGRFQIDIGDGYPKQYNVASTLLLRVHRPHPRRSWEADSPTRAALPVLRESEQLTKHIFATIDSRLAGAGILLLPSELEFPNPSEDIQPGESPFLALLAEAMMASIQDRGDARAVVPIVVQGPKDSLGTAQWLVSPAQELTAQASDLREKAIRRLAIDLDMPPEVLLGVSDSNHWGSWAVEEQSIKLHIEPVMTIICSAFTEGYLKPALIAAGLDPNKYAVWFDSSELVLRPNRATDAKDLWDRGVISAVALRTAAGFTEEDAPQGAEACLKKIEMALKAAPNLGDPLIHVIVKLLGLDACGISPADIPAINDPLGGTTPQVQQPPPPPNTDPSAPPQPGTGGNGG